jgi:O-antigen ligase
MRGGNRYPALWLLEILAVAVLFLVLLPVLRTGGLGLPAERGTASRIALAVLLLSPLWLAVVYLVPLPAGWWSFLPGRADYLQALAEAGAPAPRALALSVVPAATWASLLAGLPLLASFVIGRLASLEQLRTLAVAVLAVAVLQVLLGLAQLGGGAQSALYFGATPGRPLGSFANTNHLANYLGMALMLGLWLALESVGKAEGRHWHGGALGQAPRHTLIAWGALLALLVLGVFMTLSRGAVLSALPMAGLAGLWVGTRIWRGEQAGRRTVMLLAIIGGSALALLGAGNLIARFAPAELTGSAGFRGLLTQSSLQAAGVFWPWGAGWGTYPQAFPRFQPAAMPGYVGHAHQDYAELLFDGGVFALVLVAAFAWLAGHRAWRLARLVWGQPHVRRETLAMVLCGLGLAGFLLHSLVEFNMHIPANAMLACLLAGVFLRPMPEDRTP